MTFSITKSFLSTVAGLAWDRGLIRDVQDRVKDYVDDGGFDSPHNAQITWDHFLRQTNEWEGTFGISTMPLVTRITNFAGLSSPARIMSITMFGSTGFRSHCCMSGDARFPRS